jgi:hypothetical protein
MRPSDIYCGIEAAVDLYPLAEYAVAADRCLGWTLHKLSAARRGTGVPLADDGLG